ncbi:MAG: leucine-rich repeat protein [Candidatus Methanomethylophilaceae archaeon]|nr:leucine-rich repeat protein [Candidatus Methanomethylophilaceae archaeon]
MHDKCGISERGGSFYLRKETVIAFLVVAISLAAVISFAGDSDATSGNCGKNGDNMTWSLDGTKLTISGVDDMEDYDSKATPWGTSVTEVVFLGNPYSIGKNAFTNCSSLSSIDFGNVRQISEGAFSGCVSLKSVAISDKMISIMGDAFKGDSSLTEVTIGSKVNSIGKGAFSGCVSLKSITIGNSVVDIESDAFKGDSSLSSVTFGSSVKNIESGAFSGCPSLTSLTFPDSVRTIKSNAFNGASHLSTVTFGTGLQMLGNDAFSVEFQNKSGSKVTNPIDLAGHTYRSVSDGVLREASDEPQKCGDNLTWVLNGTKLTISGTGPMYSDFHKAPWGTDVTEVVFVGTPTSIGDSAFRECNIKSITIPDSVTTIEDDAFSYSALESIDFGNSLTYLGSYAFNGCEKLVSVKIPSTLRTIHSCAFYSCSSLSELDLGSVTYIEGSAFAGCSALKSVTIPNSVKTIEYGAFQYDRNLNYVSFGNDLVELGKDAFSVQFQDKSGKTVTALSDLRGHAFEGSDGVLRETGDVPAPIHVTGVSLDKTKASLDVGKSLKLNATVSPDNATDKSVHWESSNDLIATVDGDGNVKAVSAGQATITVSTNDGYKSAYCLVTVNAEPSPTPTPTPTPSGSDNTLLYVGIAAVIVILALLAFFFLRSRGKV